MNQKPRTIKKWTREEILTAASMWNDLCTAEEVGRFFGVSKEKITQLVFRHRRHFDQRDGVNTKNTAKLHLDVILPLFENSLSNKEIAERLGVKPNSVWQFLRRNGIRRNEDKPKAEEPQEPAKRHRTTVIHHKLTPPTPENTIIDYEFKEFSMPADALNIPFKCLEVGQCSWLDGGFWAESGPETNCCGLPVVDKRGKGLVKSFCRFHYEVSIVKE